ncbi:hypothetical protein FQN55_004012 [Onygenales sp. PD_40]|nr:hypothetical protein FQN55_004012 [Onygenales sp. PD_40]
MAVADGGVGGITNAGEVRDFNNGKKRRLLSRSDKEIIDEIDYRVDYRTGWPKPLPVLPLVVTRLPDESSIVDNLEEIEAYIATILEAQRIQWRGRFYFAYLHKPRTEPSVEDISLVVNSPQSAPSWVIALKEIRKYFMKKDIHYRIEFRNHDLLNPSTLTILPDNPIVDLWNEFYMEKVLAVIKNTAWQSVNVFHCGFGATREECPVTLIIRAWDAEQEVWWSEIIPTLRLMSPFKIRLLSTTSITATDIDVTSSELSAKAFKGRVDIGASTGIRGQKGGGTLGGMIELEFPDRSRGSFGLTNHHVVLEDTLQRETANNVALPPSNQLAINGNLVMMSPAETDTAMKLQAIREDIEIRREVIDGSNGRPGFKQQVEEFGIKSKKHLLDKHENSIKEFKETETDILKANPGLGHVAASSGYRTVDSEGCSWGTDWALIKLSEDRPMENRIIDIEPDMSMGKFELDVAKFWSTKELGPGSKLAKKGKTTNWTSGTVNAIKANLRMSRKESGGEFNLHASRDISAWVAHAPKHKRPFCSAGDNGSLVFNIDTGNVVGLLFSSDPDGNGYFTPFNLVIEDIERVTGGRVTNLAQAN